MVTSPGITVRSGEESGCPARAAPPDPGGTTTLHRSGDKTQLNARSGSEEVISTATKNRGYALFMLREACGNAMWRRKGNC